jgi:PAS domain S-box-containing protein
MSNIGNTKPDLPRLSPHRSGRRLILETALDAVVIMRSDGVVDDWNDRAAGIFGWSREEAVGRTLADLIIPERYRKAHRHGLELYLETGRAKVLGRHTEMFGLRKNGEEFPVELSISPIQDGESVLFIGYLRDITDRNALNFARIELAHVKQMMAMGEMAASIAHEINQPLAAIATNAAAGLRWLAAVTPALDEASNALTHIVNDARRASEVIGGIRSMFKKEPQAAALQDVNELIQEVLALVRREVENHRIAIHAELLDDLPQIPANRAQLRQVIVNLLMNAVEAMDAVTDSARAVRIKTEVYDPSYLRIAVEDTGTGIDPKNIDRIFDAFFSAKPNGMGMGLSICRSIIEAHGGRVWATTNVPRGAIFQFTLPRQRGAVS